MTVSLPAPLQGAPSAHARVIPNPTARDAANRLEATFLAEMLKAAGIGESSGFAGGIGEEQFASFQRQALADEMVRAGGLGLADRLYQSMMEARHDT